jgi:hypothetical protein
MAKRVKKPPVKPEKRLEWLQRVEKDGETLTHIAESDSFDIRTVRKHIELARMERDVHQARTEVLRNALERHYSDLLQTVRNIEKLVSDKEMVSMEKEQALMFGLRQHMPRSPLWENLRKWNRTLTELNESIDVIHNKIQEAIEADGRLNGIVSQGAEVVIPATVEVLVHQVKAWARGWPTLDTEHDIYVEKASEGKVRMRYGFSSFGEIEESCVETIRVVLIDFESKLIQFPEYLEIKKLYGRLGRLEASIKEILTIIQLRRIVPGRCKYCPL